MSAIVLLSGGLDSAVNLKLAVDEGRVLSALTFDYGQRAAAREAAAAALMCRQLGVFHRLIELPWLAEICRTALVDRSAAIPEVRAEAVETGAGAPTAEAVWVPNRNGVFVNIAAAFAEALGADSIVAGFNSEEAATFPDNSAAFVAATNAALSHSTLSKPELRSYTQDMTKAEIVARGREAGAPIATIWSCYLGGVEHCWRCESCARLERALRQAKAWEWFHTNRTIA
ncbi:MAG: 7-cyano-7-deazaguanine synthase QueC [Armatimonadota bacterium]